MTTINEFHLLVNPTSGSGKGKRMGHHIKQYIEQKGKTVQLHESQYPGHITKLTAELAQQISLEKQNNSLIVIIGGDGSLNEALNGLSDEYSTVPLGFVPSGSGNDFARGVGISSNPKEAIEQVLAAAQPYEIDVLYYTDQATQRQGYAVNNFGLGLDASIIKQVNHSSSKSIYNRLNLNKLTYLSAVVSNFMRQQPFPLTINMDGKVESFERAFLVTTNNHPYFGSGIKISPPSNPTDGKLDLIVLERISALQFLRLFFILFVNGKHLEDDLVHYYSGKQLHLRALKPVEGQTDGEELGEYPYDLTLQTVKRFFWFATLD